MMRIPCLEKKMGFLDDSPTPCHPTPKEGNAYTALVLPPF